MSDIRIESFDVDKANGNTHTLTTDVGSLSSAFVKNINNSRKGSAGPVGSTGNANPNAAAMAAELTATDTLTFRNGSGTQKMMGEVWRYTGSTGGANEFIVRGRVAVTVTGASATAAISGIVTGADCVPFVSGYESDQTSTDDYDAGTFAVRMDGAGNVEVSRQATTGTIIVYITVVEFTGSNWTVGSGVSASHDTSRQEITLTTDHGDWSTAFIEATGQGDTTENGLADTMFLCYPGSATDTVWVDYQSGDGAARNDGTAYVYVVSNPDLIVTRNGSNQALAEGDNSYGADVSFPAGASTARDLDQLGLEWFVTTSGTGAAHARGSIAARITNAATGIIRNWVHRSGNNILIRYAVIDVSQLNAPTGTDVNAERAAEVDGVSTDAESRDAEIDGSMDETSERDAEIDGKAAASGGFPVTTTATETAFSISVTSMAVNLPGSISSGDLLLGIVEVRNVGTWTIPSGWVELLSPVSAGGVGGFAVFYKIADGSEGSTATWTHSVTTTTSWGVRKITNWDGTTAPEIADTNSGGTPSTNNPPSLSPSWGSADTLWIAAMGTAANGTTITGAPAGYSDLVSTVASAGGAQTNVGTAYIESASASEDPGSFTTSSDRWWVAATIAIRPGAGGGTATNSERDAEVSGQASDNSERDAEVTGVDTDTSERDAQTHGTDTDQSERGAEVTGADTDTSERGAEVSGQLSDNTERDAEISGGPGWEIQRNDDNAGWVTIEADVQIDETTGTYNYTDTSTLTNGVEYCYRVREISPDVSEWSNIDCFTFSGGTDVSSERDAEIDGTDTDNAERAAEVTGSLDDTDERDAEVTGQASDNSERDAEIDGTDTDNAERAAEVTGTDTDNAERAAEVTGDGGDVAERFAEIDGLGAVTGNIKYWDGSQWQIGVVKYWNGTVWGNTTVKYWNGGVWVTINY